MRSSFILFLALFIGIESFGCDCKNLGPLDSLRVKSYDWSEIVFLGELFEYDTINKTYTFKILESYKGCDSVKIVKGKYFDSCSKFPKDKCRWIIYADYREDDIIDISSCLASRSEMNPNCINCHIPPKPISIDATEKEKEDSSKESEEFKLKIKEDWEEEIDWLRLISESNNIVGIWFSETLITIDSMYDPITFVNSIDTNYRSLPILFEFHDNGTLNATNDYLLNGTWDYHQDSYNIKFDTLEFSAEFQNNKLIIVLDSLRNESLSLIKLQEGSTNKILKETLISTRWEYTYDDTLKYSLYFIDSNTVIMNNGDLTISGDWNIQYLCGYNIIYIDDSQLDSHFYVLTDEFEQGYKGFTYHYYWFREEYPIKSKFVYSRKEILTDSQISDLKALISYHWINTNDFYPNKPDLIDDELLTELSFEIEFNDTAYQYKHSGIGEKTGNLYQIARSGKWELGKTGDYLTLYFIEEINGKTYKHSELVTIKKLSETELIIGKHISALSHDHGGYGTREIRFKH